ncbi:MAG: AmmeMemoRadiSam system protein B [Hahellaceae bacterium]|nr:AmmeMemoRadiSam system protein B [Hahellaceae bacterium]MCP5168854.1 AmmeMemoRadiSam system protein B [Hahellaceae bacterium]
MLKHREPAVSGLFYPSDSATLKAQVAGYLADAELSGEGELSFNPRALIVPHAGYIYSGIVAAAGYATLEPLRTSISRVLLLGPSHRVPLEGMATCSADYFATPLGEVLVDRLACLEAEQWPGVAVNDAAHQLEHSLEVQLPFLQSVLDHFSLIPVVVGATSVNEVAALINYFMDFEDTLVVVSSDLSHYHSYAQASLIDQSTADTILTLDHSLQGEQACGCYAVNGLLKVAADRGMAVELVSLANSGDTAGDKQRVVGYGAFAFGIH